MNLLDLMDDVSETRNQLCDRSLILKKTVQIYPSKKDIHTLSEPDETIKLTEFKRRLRYLPDGGNRNRNGTVCFEKGTSEMLKVEDIHVETDTLIRLQVIDSHTGEVVHCVEPVVRRKEKKWQ